MQKKLFRSRDNRTFSGVLGGLGEFFGIDPTLLRLVYVLLTVFTGFVPGIIGYLIAIAVVPEAPIKHTRAKVKEEAKDDAEAV